MNYQTVVDEMTSLPLDSPRHCLRSRHSEGDEDEGGQKRRMSRGVRTVERGENGRKKRKVGRTRVRGRNIEGAMERRKVTQRTDDGKRCGARRGRVEGRGRRRGEANVASAELDLCDASEDLPQIHRVTLE